MLFLVTGELVEMCSVNARLQRLHPFTNRPCSLGGCNLSSACFPRIVQSVSALHLPLLILGGGGYNEVATVKAWVAATAAACGAELPGSVPLHDFYAEYGPTFCFQHVSAVFIFVIAQSTLVTVHNFTGLQRLDARWKFAAEFANDNREGTCIHRQVQNVNNATKNHERKNKPPMRDISNTLVA